MSKSGRVHEAFRGANIKVLWVLMVITVFDFDDLISSSLSICGAHE